MVIEKHTESCGVVLLHPAGGDHRLWNKVTALLNANIPVYCPDFMENHIKIGGVMTFPHVADELDAWASRCGLEHFVLGGISLGGMAAQYFAGLFPKRIGGLILGNTNYIQDASQQLALRERAIELQSNFDGYIEKTLNRWFTMKFSREHNDDIAWVRKVLYSVPVAAHSAAWTLISSLDSQEYLSKIDAPVKIIGGTKDRSTPLKIQREIKELCVKSELLSNDAAHMSCVERPSIWARTIENLWEEVNFVSNHSN